MCKVASKEFKAVVIRNNGLFKDYARLVPEAAQAFLMQGHLVQNSSGLEVAFYEPKRGEDHLEGTFFTGYLVHEQAETLPDGMEYIEAAHTYASIRGKTGEMGDLYTRLNHWLSENDRQQSINQYIIEVYYPAANEEEEAEVFIPIND
ncbi:AraC family transcriptional regulator [Paenibacillus sp. FSL R5-0490]|uniref:GyrI-like domain-containing protein n=1 Tax=Paenibacillus sp. FSL R5-0490 TaxID=1920424 RepID=UPI00096C9709|nr:GyrI-like domain-containing protein [Paenibacillus sp. FSL R5-0490]OMF54885.1 AraC family transcriptional regulator [Paenibacillus sp. FSL R5-0490]